MRVTPAVRMAQAGAVRLAVGAGEPVVCCPFLPARPPCWRAGDFAAAELGGIRYLELLPPLVYVGLAHRERLMRCRCLAPYDPGELDVLVHGQVDHLAGCPGRSRQPAQGRPFIAVPEP